LLGLKNKVVKAEGLLALAAVRLGIDYAAEL